MNIKARYAGRKAQRNGKREEDKFDRLCKLWTNQGQAYFIDNHARRNKKGEYISKGKFDRCGVICGLSVGIEIKSVTGKNFAPSALPQHELVSLVSLAKCKGQAFILIEEHKDTESLWLCRITPELNKMPSREQWIKTDWNTLLNDLKREIGI